MRGGGSAAAEPPTQRQPTIEKTPAVQLLANKLHSAVLNSANENAPDVPQEMRASSASELTFRQNKCEPPLAAS